MDRILVIGCSAAGKSTVSRELGRLLGIEVIHLDKLLWKPGCQLVSPEEEPDVVRSLLDPPRWIMDGNYVASLPMRLAAADTVVVVDFSRSRCLARAMKRLLQYRGRTRPDMGEECPEQLNLAFFRWIWNYPHSERPTLLRHLDQHGSHTRVVFLRNPAEMENWLAQLRRTFNGKEAAYDARTS
jgi:adenylate kinase family enzyme